VGQIPDPPIKPAKTTEQKREEFFNEDNSADIQAEIDLTDDGTAGGLDIF